MVDQWKLTFEAVKSTSRATVIFKYFKYNDVFVVFQLSRILFILNLVDQVSFMPERMWQVLNGNFYAVFGSPEC